MTADALRAEVLKLDPKPGEVIVVRVRRSADDKEREDVMRALSLVLDGMDGVQGLLVEEGVTLSVAERMPEGVEA